MRFFMPLFLLILLAGIASADWVPSDGHKMHFPQLPDLENGMDVLVSAPKILADDFLCTQTGPITDVHMWASWLGDQIGDPHIDLYIFSDIPASQSATGYSMPGELLWSRHFHPPEIVIGETLTAAEPFYNPNTNEIIGSDTQVIQYNFFIPPTEAFVQQKDTIYWLGLQKRNITDELAMGWKTSAEQWNDDAVWGDLQASTLPGMTPPGATIEWNELIHPDTGASLDLSFVITPEPASLSVLAAGALALLARRRR